MHWFKTNNQSISNKPHVTKYPYDSNNTNFFTVHDEKTGMMKVHGDNGG